MPRQLRNTTKEANRLKLTHSLISSLIFLLLTLNHQTDSLVCVCNTCAENVTTCETTDHKGSMCYKKVQQEFNGDSTETFAEFGCISSSEGYLGMLQCHTNIAQFRDLTYMRCCNGVNLCNELIPDPSEQDDARWNVGDQMYAKSRTYSPDIVRWIFMIASLLLGCITLAVFLLIKYMRSPIDRKSITSRDSICSLKADLEKFNHHFPGSSSPTHSYSISESLSHKQDSLVQDASCMTVELTSGIGERMLNLRTMARTVGFGRTDHVGNGRFGRVFRGEYHGENVAVKAFRTIDQDSWQREDEIFRTLNHENIVRFIASEVTTVENSSTEIWMFLEYCPYGSLCDWLDHHDVLGPQQAVKILYSIINGLNYLHEDYSQGNRPYKPSIAHRDIKSKNILMRTPDVCCIADFGHALIKKDENRLDYGKYNHLQVGTIRYMAPEILAPDAQWNLNFGQFSTFAQADLYQYGLILWEVCYRTAINVLHPAGEHKLPYDGKVPQNPSVQDMIKIVCQEQYRPPRCEKWERYPTMKRLSEIMVECWRPNPKARMETLGVKKKVKELFDQYVTPPHRLPFFDLNLSSYQSSFRNDTRSIA